MVEEIGPATAASLTIERAPEQRTRRKPPLDLRPEGTTDGLQLFLKGIGKVRLLTAQEEVALAKRIGSCPTGTPDPDRVSRVLGLGEDERSVIVVTFGYAAGVRDPQRRSAEEWVARADRESVEAVVRRL